MLRFCLLAPVTMTLPFICSFLSLAIQLHGTASITLQDQKILVLEDQGGFWNTVCPTLSYWSIVFSTQILCILIKCLT